jgi:hypothetical protein
MAFGLQLSPKLFFDSIDPEQTLAVTASHEILPLFDLIHDQAADHSHGSNLFRTWGKPTIDHFGGEDVRLRRRFIRLPE